MHNIFTNVLLTEWLMAAKIRANLPCAWCLGRNLRLGLPEWNNVGKVVQGVKYEAFMQQLAIGDLPLNAGEIPGCRLP